MGNIEILAPAGGQEQLEAAVKSGADAVYLGLNGFNARANAHNFSDPCRVVSYCHSHGVKVHFTVNTLVNDDELPHLFELLKSIGESGADAVIVQDLATFRIIKSCIPEMKIHASTQMTAHNLSGVKFLEKMGFDRVVLSRELSLNEIKYICENTSIEIEVFVHGALCMCMSGTCYLSSVLGGRSGNRGYCAQPCRLDFSCNNNQYALSLKDMCHIPYIEALKNAGVCSLKIEGRMKRPEYVSAAVTSCKKQLKGENPDLELLRSVFSRSGFTDGYLKGKINREMFGFRTKEDVISAEKAFKQIRLNYKNEYQSLPVDFEFSAKKGEPCSLSARINGHLEYVEGDIPSPALNRPLDCESVEERLSKTGGTQFYVNSIECDIDEGLNLSITEINGLRRSVLEKQNNYLSMIHPFAVSEYKMPDKYNRPLKDKPSVFVHCERYEQARFLGESQRIILPMDEIISHPECAEIFGNKLCVAPPQICFNDKKAMEKLSKIRKMGVKHLYANNIWHIEAGNNLDFTLHAGYGLNIFNSVAVGEYENMGLSDITLSFELSAKKIKKINGKNPIGIIAYGHLPVMQVRACPARGKTGCEQCTGQPVLKDRMGKIFPIICNNKEYSTILNPLPLDLRGKNIENIDFVTLWFTSESAEECQNIFESFKDMKDSKPCGEFTRGLYFKEVL